MNTQSINSIQVRGLSEEIITVEAFKTRGNQPLSITGLPDTWLKESRDKIKALVSNINRWSPMERILVHLLPPDQQKTGAHLELPIIISILCAQAEPSKQKAIQSKIKNTPILGSLNLSGEIEHTQVTQSLAEYGTKNFIGPHTHSTLEQLWFELSDDYKEFEIPEKKSTVEFKDLKNQKRLTVNNRSWEQFWLLCAVVAKTPVLLIGPPGVGKSHLALWAHELIPMPNPKEYCQIKRIWSLIPEAEIETIPPLVTPHSRAQLSEFMGVSRSGIERPGLFPLAHNGLLILDEFNEMNRDCREILRTVLDSKTFVKNTRSGYVKWPASFSLILTANPCPCGFAKGEDLSKCKCTERKRIQYAQRLSGPLLSRVGLKLFIDEATSNNSNFSEFFKQDLESIKRQISVWQSDVTQLELKALKAVKNSLYLKNMSERDTLLKSKLLAAYCTITNASIEKGLSQISILKKMEDSVWNCMS